MSDYELDQRVVPTEPATIATMTARIEEIREQRLTLDKEYRQLQYDLYVAEAEVAGMPQEDGWYLDSNGQIARREDGHWHDGWGNRGPDYGHFAPPMTRLLPASPGTCSSPGCILEPGHEIEKPSGSGVIPAVPHKTLTCACWTSL